MIDPQDLGIPDTVLARRVLAHARTTIAPGLDSLEGDALEDAVAILSGVATEAMGRGSRSVTSQSVGTAKVSYGAAASWFSADDAAALRALCQQTPAVDAGHPVGRFPAATRAFRHMWPEEPNR